EGDLHDLGVAGCSVADLPVGRVRDVPARIARHDALDAAQLLVDRFQTPEATAGERRQLPRLFSAHLYTKTVKSDCKYAPIITRARENRLDPRPSSVVLKSDFDDAPVARCRHA